MAIVDYRLIDPKIVERSQPLMGKIEEGFKMRENLLALREKERLRIEEETMRGTLNDLTEQGIAWHTPEGIDKVLGDPQVRSRFSPDALMRLTKFGGEIKRADVDYRAALAKQDATVTGAEIETITALADPLKAWAKQYADDVAAHGTQYADDAATRARDKFLAEAAPVFGRTPLGQSALGMLKNATPAQVPLLLQRADYEGTLRKRQLEQARVEQMRAAATAGGLRGAVNYIDAENRVVVNLPGRGLFYTDTEEVFTGDPTKLRPMPAARPPAAAEGRWELFQDPATRISYRVNAQTGAVEQQPEGTSGWTAAPGGLPATVVKPGTAQAARAQERIAIPPEPPLRPEENAKLAEYARVYGRSIPAPQFGTGAAATSARTAFYRNLINDMESRGETPTTAALQSAMARASQESLKRITTIDTVLRSEEGEALKLLDEVQKELERLGGIASPYLRGKWNQVETQLIGSPDFVRLNTLMSTFIDTLGRLSSNATGAAGTPVAYLNFAKQFANKDFNLEQMKAFKPTFEDFVKARRVGVDSALKNLTEKMAPPPRRAEPGGREEESTRIIRAEYDKAVKDLEPLTGDARKRKLEDVRALRRELKAKGVDVPDVADAAGAGKQLPTGDRLKAYADKHFKGDVERATQFLKSQGYTAP